jgi:hypothetical protein
VPGDAPAFILPLFTGVCGKLILRPSPVHESRKVAPMSLSMASFARWSELASWRLLERKEERACALC